MKAKRADVQHPAAVPGKPSGVVLDPKAIAEYDERSMEEEGDTWNVVLLFEGLGACEQEPLATLARFKRRKDFTRKAKRDTVKAVCAAVDRIRASGILRGEL